MKVSELPGNASLDKVKVRIPDSIPDAELSLIGLDTRDVYIKSVWGYGSSENSGVWVSKSTGEGRIFPLTGHEGKEVLEWDVVEPKE